MQGYFTDGAGSPVMRALVLGALLLPAAASVAQSVQKCVAIDGHVTLTSGECGAGHRLVASYEAVPEEEPPLAGASATASVEPRRARTSPRGAGRTSGGASPRVGRAPDRCQAARDRRERTLRRVGLKRTFDLLRKLDDDVWAACRRP